MIPVGPEHGHIAFGLFNPNDQTNQTGVFQPPAGATFHVIVASNILTQALLVRGPIWGDGLHFNWGVVTRPDGLQALRLVATHVPPPWSSKAPVRIELAYPTNYSGYTLQNSPRLSPANWTTILSGTNLRPTNVSGFFRLSKP
jgi:hypothetical protein